MNNVNFMGMLVADPELRYTPKGVAVCSFRLALKREFANADGEYEADFVKVITFGKSAEFVANHQKIKKGFRVALTGSIRTGRYEDGNGVTQYTWNVVTDRVTAIDYNKDSKETSKDNRASNDPFKDDGKPVDISDDELPF